MSVYLATLADAAPLPRCPGVSTRALRSALRMMCRIAQGDGTMRYGLRASKLAALCEYSSATIHRAERQLVEHGYIERVRLGGGRLSTHWRIVVDKLAPHDAESGRAAGPTAVTTTPPAPVRRRWTEFRRTKASTIVTTICPDHGGDGGTLADGTPRCPQCRQHRAPPRR